MFKQKETFIKYLAGMIDADGSLSFQLSNGYCGLIISIHAAEAIDHKWNMINYLRKNLTGQHTIYTYDHNGVETKQLKIQKRSAINALIPRLLKHLVIKGKHFDRMLKTWQEFRGHKLSKKETEYLKYFAKDSRRFNGPFKPKKHPTWAWAAGYLDGDGCFYMGIRHRGNSTWTDCRVTVTAHELDKCGIELLQKAFNGNILKRSGKPWLLVWTRNLGKRDKSFVVRFLPKVHRHSIIKKWKIEQILAFHNAKNIIPSAETEREDPQGESHSP